MWGMTTRDPALDAYDRGERNATLALLRSVIGTGLVYLEAHVAETEVERDGWIARLRLLRAATRLLDKKVGDPAVKCEVDDMRQALQVLACEP